MATMATIAMSVFRFIPVGCTRATVEKRGGGAVLAVTDATSCTLAESVGAR